MKRRPEAIAAFAGVGQNAGIISELVDRRLVDPATPHPGTKEGAVSVISAAGLARPLHPLHAILLAFAFPFFLGALCSDLAYSATFHVQWANFASWLIVGGLLGGGFALLWALINLFRGELGSKGRRIAYFIVLLAMWTLGFINALIHAKDAWATMPEGLYLSAVVTLLAFVAALIGYSGFRAHRED